MSKDYYKILGVSKSATEAEIKSAFRKLAKEYHPDRHSGNKDMEAKFKEVSEAYDTLSNSEKRKRYDTFGSDASHGFGGGQGGFGGGFGGGQGGFGNFDFGDIFRSAGFGDFGDLFGGGKSGPQAKQAGEDLKYKIDITLEEAFYGKEKQISFKTYATCSTCDGTGSKDKKETTCKSCNGSGSIRYQQGFFLMEQTCKTCGGSGKVPANPCLKCSGEGRVFEQKNVVFDIPKGIMEGMNIKLSGKGASGKNKAPNGDLYVEVSIKKHDTFERVGNDLVCSIPVSFGLLTLGGHVSVEGIDGDKINVEIPKGTQTGHVFTIKSKGMPIMKSGGKNGDMKIKVDVVIPTSLTKDQTAKVKELEEVINQSNNPFSSKKGFFEKIKTIINN